jgi:hypothetical protein
MSLWVYLTRKPHNEPDVDDETGLNITHFEWNITHNLANMADEAGIYEFMWRPDEVGVTQARELIQPLSVGLMMLKARPGHFKTFNPTNGWGDYDGLVHAVDKYLEACREYPDAYVHASR